MEAINTHFIFKLIDFQIFWLWASWW